MYNKSAKFYDALFHFRNYKSASEKLHQIVISHNPSAKTLLDTACGTGKHIEHLEKYFDTEGLDINDELLKIAKERCPQIKVHLCSMIEFDLKRKYDVVTCLFGSIAYAKTQDNLYKAIESMSNHLNESGLLIIEPYFSEDNYWLNHVTSNHYDEKDLKITWMYTSKKENGYGVSDINYLVGTPEEVSYFRERHELGLFNDEQYRDSMKKAGLDIEHSDESLFGKDVGNGMYIGIKK